MTKKQTEALWTRNMRGRGVYRPYVTVEFDGAITVESYPLAVRVANGGMDAEMGPFHSLKLTDCTLPRIGQDSTITTHCVYMGTPMDQMVAQLLLDYHGPAYERAQEQERAVTA